MSRIPALLVFVATCGSSISSASQSTFIISLHFPGGLLALSLLPRRSPSRDSISEKLTMPTYKENSMGANIARTTLHFFLFSSFFLFFFFFFFLVWGLGSSVDEEGNTASYERAALHLQLPLSIICISSPFSFRQIRCKPANLYGVRQSQYVGTCCQPDLSSHITLSTNLAHCFSFLHISSVPNRCRRLHT
ncbi:hypothetical protein QBC35DRAFT_207501 [Podospora australis]|uniref:Secreted protein n=1 Tax=Podospora australis TaxID=1536484 RepID=A0AAN6WU37_9PEZI|nr:hypothetical protein QBC35DRAFT_207501 [Podospora australis]